MNLTIRIRRLFNRVFRKVKTFLLRNEPPLLTWLFFNLLGWLDNRLSGRRQTEAVRLTNQLWKQAYFDRYQRTESVPFQVETAHPVAHESNDHRFPRGTIRDSSTNGRFNCRLYDLLFHRRDLRFLDLGCAGGGLVRSYLEDGYQACGIEGSTASREVRSGEWDTIPFHLFTADITKPFQVRDVHGNDVQFHAITAWEVLEHIPESALPGVISNLHKHIIDNGYFIASIDLLPDGNPLLGAVYHQTLKTENWWNQQFEEAGFEVVREALFAPEEMVRGGWSQP